MSADSDPAPGSATRTLHQKTRADTSASTSDSLDHGRFVPGTLLLERYRILGLLGRGGMGEVYRADDLRLGQTVALKFLPPDVAQDPGRLARFHNEVRLARQVSHPSVVRVYDVGEYLGQPFLSMEYIDGEDLGTLLRRIGRLPRDKATEVARQICAGLAAAHDRGVVHRDLKPANVMIDGRGRARIADFGLAGALGADDGLRGGTPAYMSPEQLAGSETGLRSDLYALGLVLYELYTGKRAFSGDSLADIRRARDRGPTSPSSLVDDLDPAVERVIKRCLADDPAQRPATALAVAASLPGGDPLAMALAAGETPSPEMVAAAGEAGALVPRVVLLTVAGIAAAIFVAAQLGQRTTVLSLSRPPRSPEVLVDRGRQMLEGLGFTTPPVDTSLSLGWHRTYCEHLQASDPSPDRWDRLSRPIPPAIYFDYRESPVVMEPAHAGGVVTPDDPPLLTPGMVHLMLTPKGDLWRFETVPPQIDDDGDRRGAPADWAPWFAAAGLAPGDFKPAEPRWVPVVNSDARMAWEGPTPGAPELPMRIEAASYRGKPVSFGLYWSWNRPLRSQPFLPSASEKGAQSIILSLVVSALVAGIVLARRNLQEGRGDRRGALRLAGAIVFVQLAGSIAQAAHFSDFGKEWNLLERLIGWALYAGGTVWIFYLALEPEMRRRSPERIISWTRLLSGNAFDPLVGRDLLAGVAFGSLMIVADRLHNLLPVWLGHAPPLPLSGALDLFTGVRGWIAVLGDETKSSVQQALVIMVILLLLRIVFRKPWGAALGLPAVACAVLSFQGFGISGVPGIPLSCAMGVLLTYVLLRHGLLALAMTFWTWRILVDFNLSADWGAWYGRPIVFTLLIIAALVLFSARAALAGRSVFDLRAKEA
jgi:serine/threonine-protein kinase